MKAAVYRRYGGPEVIEIAEVPKPVPKDNEVLVKVHAATVSPIDCRARSLDVPKLLWPMARLRFGVRRPVQPILGTELAGVIESVGKSVARFKPGDQVFAFPDGEMGSHAEYRALPADGAIAVKPANMSFEEAATLPDGGCVALNSLRAAKVKPGETMLVLGASGIVGSALVQIATDLGAVVTGVTNAAAPLVASLGAARVMNFPEFTTSLETYDVVADAEGWTSFAASKHALKERGRLIAVSGRLSTFLAMIWAPGRGTKRVFSGRSMRPRVGDMERLGELAAAGRFRPLVDRVYDFTEIRHAHTHVESRRARGSVVVRIAADSEYAGTALGWLGVAAYDFQMQPLAGGDEVGDSPLQLEG